MSLSNQENSFCLIYVWGYAKLNFESSFNQTFCFGACVCKSSSFFFFFPGQKVCFADFKHPCYKMAYFHELSSRVSFQEARLACESEGGALLTLENEAEQKLIESMLQNLTKPGTGISDGDFWIGLWRSGEGQASGACPDLYQWSDGSSSQYR